MGASDRHNRAPSSRGDIRSSRSPHRLDYISNTTSAASRCEACPAHPLPCQQQTRCLISQVLPTDVDHNAASLQLFTDVGGRLLFNAGEGLQRMFRENKLRIGKVRPGLPVAMHCFVP